MKPLTEREIFFEALKMPTPESRAAYLQAACGQDTREIVSGACFVAYADELSKTYAVFLAEDLLELLQSGTQTPIGVLCKLL